MILILSSWVLTSTWPLWNLCGHTLEFKFFVDTACTRQLLEAGTQRMNDVEAIAIEFGMMRTTKVLINWLELWVSIWGSVLIFDIWEDEKWGSVLCFIQFSALATKRAFPLVHYATAARTAQYHWPTIWRLRWWCCIWVSEINQLAVLLFPSS